MIRLVLLMPILLLLPAPAAANMVLARSSGGFALTGYQEYNCPGPSAVTSCTPITATTVTNGHILLVMTSYCLATDCVQTSVNHVSSVGKSSGGATIGGSCTKLAGMPFGGGPVPINTEMWWCSVTGTGSIIPVVSYSGSVFYPYVGYVDISGTSASPDDGAGNMNLTTGTSVTVALAGTLASQAGELLVFSGFMATGNGASASMSAGWTLFPGSSLFGYNPNGVLGANSVTVNWPSNGTSAIIGAIAALKHP